MRRAEFDKIIGSTTKPEDRISWFGALLSRESKTSVEIVGGSAIEIYLSSEEYTSQSVDLVGRGDRFTPVLRRWGFERAEGRGHRVYWLKRSIGLVDIVGGGDRSGLRPRKLNTPYGTVLVSAVEPLVARRLMRAHREKSRELYVQAEKLAKQGDLDWDYLKVIAAYEGFEPLLIKLRKSLTRA